MPRVLTSPLADDARMALPAQVALVAGAEGDVRERLGADLMAVGYAPILIPSWRLPEGDALPCVVLVLVDGDATEAIRFSRACHRSRSLRQAPVVWGVPTDALSVLRRAEGAFDDFVELPSTREGLAARLRAVRHRTGQLEQQVLRCGRVVINLSTYQAWVGDAALDLTYMEYRLLRFLASHPWRVHTRRSILSEVWGVEYYGGARTVDVHVRRLRVKLGQEQAGYIETVRSVGYRFVPGRE